jgi:ribosome biogenesis ATPase
VRLLEQNEYFLKIRGLGAEEDDESDDEELLEVDESSNMMNSSLREVYGSINKIEENEIIINASEKEKEKPDEEGQKKLAANKKRKGSDLGKSSSSGAAKKSQKSVSEWNALVEKPTVTTYADVGGMEKVLQEVRELVEPALLHPEIYEHLGVSAPSGILLHGPPGCGKTLLVHAIAGELGVNFLKVAAPEIVSGMSGESEAKVRSLFEEAIQASPCLLFLDEIDAITPKRENAGKEMERRIVAQLLNSMDELGKSGASVVVIGATNRPDSLDSALRRAGRFEREVLVGIPDESARNSILRKMACKMKLEGAFNFEKIARLTPGFVGADLASLTKEAASIAIRRVYQGLAESTSRSEVSDHLKSRTERLTPEELEPLFVRMEDFEQALSVIQPSSKREGFATIPDVSWEDIGALDTLRKQLHMSVVLPIRSPELFRSVGLSSPAGALLFGPPGCGKTVRFIFICI